MFADEGDGTLLPTTAETMSEMSSRIHVGTLAGSGGEVYLDALDISVNALLGKPVIVGGSVSPTGTWTLTAADVMDGTPLDNVDLTGCSRIVMSDEEVRAIAYQADDVTEYVLARGATAAVPVCEALSARLWRTALKGNGDLVLKRVPPGMFIIFR